MRRLVAGLAAGLLVLSASLVGAGPAQAGTPTVGPPTAISASQFALRTDMTMTNAASRLSTALGSGNYRSVADMMSAANRVPGLCRTNEVASVRPVIDQSSSPSYRCWNQEDADTDRWWPQGITSTADALGAGTYDGVGALAVSSYDKTDVRGSRLTLFPPFEDGNYRHLLLVEPYIDSTGRPNFRKVDCHAGGVLWYGHHLFTACTNQIRVFDWDRVYRVGLGTGIGWVSSTGQYEASDYAYVMIQTGRLTDAGSSAMRYSSISLDRASTPDKLVVSEWNPDAGGRLVRWNLDYTTRLPSGGGTVTAADAYQTKYQSMQGAISRGTKFWFASSNGEIGANSPISQHYGLLRYWDSATARHQEYKWAYGAESLSYWGWGDGDGGMLDVIFSVNEYPGYRAITSIPQSDVN